MTAVVPVIYTAMRANVAAPYNVKATTASGTPILNLHAAPNTLHTSTTFRARSLRALLGT